MKVTLDEHGVALPDVEMEQWVKDCFEKGQDIHISNLLTLDYVRAYLKRIPADQRPQVQWFVYGCEVCFDNDLRSHDAFLDSRTDTIRPLVELF